MIGAMVTYRLSEEDAKQVNRRRTSGGFIRERLETGDWPSGAQAHIGNHVSAGDTFPMIVVKVIESFSPPLSSLRPPSPRVVNGQVFLDGNDVLWVQGVRLGGGHGEWFAG